MNNDWQQVTTRFRPVWIAAALCIASTALYAGALTVTTAPSFTTPGRNVNILLETGPTDTCEPPINVTITNAGGIVVFEQSVTPSDGHAIVSWTPQTSGLHQVTACSGHQTPPQISVPIINEKRPVDFVWYRPFPGMRWPTVVTHAIKDRDEVRQLRERGIKALKWKSGSAGNFKRQKHLSPPVIRANAQAHYTLGNDFAYDGIGIDEFLAYPQTERYLVGWQWLLGLADAAKTNSHEFSVAAWHAGIFTEDWLGIYRSAVDFLLLETYVTYFCPHALGSENINRDLLVHSDRLRNANLFTRVYGGRGRALLSLDLCGRKGSYQNPDELEEIFRHIRRIVPEMRGLCLYNGSYAENALCRAADDLCFKYFIKPVVTFQAESIWLDRYVQPNRLVAALSNIGAMDSGPVSVVFRVNGEQAGIQTVPSVPPGHNRLDNRVLLSIPWTASVAGIYTLEAEIAEAGQHTVLDGHIGVDWFLPAATDQ